MTGWVAALAELAAAGRPAVLVTVLRAEGSTPREAGAKMVVWEGGFEGTIGGGHLEQEALAAARELLAIGRPAGDPPRPVVRDFALGPSLGQCCGGRATVLFEAILAPGWHVAVFGAGHVGKALVKLLGDLPCTVRWIDGRESEFPQVFPKGVRRVVTDAPEDEVGALLPGTDVLVMTHSHQLDFQILEAAMKWGRYGYLGLIGSRTKRATFEQRLAARGRSAEELARLTCPIGIPGVGGKSPPEIAVAVAAQLLQTRSASSPIHPERSASGTAHPEPFVEIRAGGVEGRAGQAEPKGGKTVEPDRETPG